MELSEFTLRIILLFLPGIISFKIYEIFTEHRPFKLHEIVFGSFIFGFMSYYLYFLFICIINLIPSVNIEFVFQDALINPDQEIVFSEIGFATVSAALIGILATLLSTYKCFYKMARRTGLTRKYGDTDLFNYLMNSNLSGNKMEWVVIRHKRTDLMYYCWISAWSCISSENELFLRDVQVFVNSTGQKLYEIPGLYLPAKWEDLTIEFPFLKILDVNENDSGDESNVSG